MVQVLTVNSNEPMDTDNLILRNHYEILILEQNMTFSLRPFTNIVLETLNLFGSQITFLIYSLRFRLTL